MKKLFLLLTLLVCCLILCACTLPSLPFLPGSCTTHIDNDGNLKCDVCGTDVTCTTHRDLNEDLKCDACGAAITCTHKDADNDGECDIRACDYVFCEHEYEDEYSYNKTYHYFKPSCDCDTDPKDKEKHEDENNDGICDVCEWNYNHKHTYEMTWSYDEKNHWYEVTCTHDVKGADFAPHADKDNDGICDECLWDYDHTHTYEEEWSHDENDHWFAVSCDHDIEVKDKASHEDEDNDGICDGCSWNYDHEHTYNENIWRFDEENHWHAPTCKHDVPGKDLAAHADEDDDGLCDVCSYIVCDNHTCDLTKWEYDATTHWHPSKCGHASAMMEAAGHLLDKEGLVCTECGYQTNHKHEFPEDWEFDEESHWKVSTCHNFITTEKEAHTDENNDGICEECLNQYCQHTYTDEWSHDKDNHWREADCGHVTEPTDKAAHKDENNDAICDVCSWDYDHIHEFKEEWSHDNDYHWHDVDCGHTIEVADKALHKDENNDGICDGCSWDYDHTHTFAEEWSYDLTGHFYAPTCGHNAELVRKDFAPHTDENDNGYCSVCEKQYCEHEMSTDWTHDTVNHWHAPVCSHSSQIEDLEAHKDENNDGICDVCTWDYDHTHEFEEEWSHDSEYHWHAVDCGHNIEVADKAAHKDENNDGVCDGCSWDYDHTHEFKEEWSHDNDYHWHDVDCGHNIEVADKAAHKDENNDGICDGCLWNYDHTHTYDNTTWAYDKDNHYHAANCGHNVPGIDVTPHTDEDNNGVCDVCLNQYCDNHVYSDAWIYDGKYHWHESACGHSLAIQKVEHFDTLDGGDGFCDDCGRSMTCEHTYDESEWIADGTHHWHAPTCGHDENDTIDSRIPHTDANNDLKCDVCEKGCDVGTDDGEIDKDNAVPMPDHTITP